MKNWNEENRKIAQWMKDYAKNAKIKGFVIGLSGGIDSSVIACLAVKAVGKENVVGVSLPCQSKPDMHSDAKELAENLDIRFQTIQINQPVGDLAQLIKQSQLCDVDQLVLANIKARIRMTTLYAIAGANNYLVAGTGNKSELTVGYFTKFGDGAVDMEPLGEYYKREVYLMANEMPEIPESVKTKAPTADLWDGQTDEDELGMTYDKLEKVLIRCEQGEKWMDVYKDMDGITEEEFLKVRGMINKSAHKNELPPQYARE